MTEIDSMGEVKNFWLRKGSQAEKLGFPSQYQLRLPLLQEIAKRGGQDRPSDLVEGQNLYEALGHRVGLTEAAMSRRRGEARSTAWMNHVAWVRFTLVKQGYLQSGPPGRWRLSKDGRRSVQHGRLEAE